jgi:anti-sigma factor RsiW
MTCRQFAHFMMDYQSGDLPAAVRHEFDTHLSRCANCRKYLTSYEETVKLGRRAFDDDDAALPAEVPEDLVRAIIAAHRR